MNAGAGDFTLQSLSPAKGAGDGGVDLGAFAVYGPTVAGWNPSLSLSDVLVEFEEVISEVSRGEQVQLVLRLNRVSQDRVTVDVVPVAGDARVSSDFTIGGATVTFEPGETTKQVTVSVIGSSQHDELVAFGLANVTCGQPGARNLRLLRIGS